MRIRASIAGVVMLAVLGGAGEWAGCYTRIWKSVDAWRHSYRLLEGEDKHLNSLDRLLLALILAKAETAQPRK